MPEGGEAGSAFSCFCGNPIVADVLLSVDPQRGKETAMKEFHCGTLVPGCDWHTRAEQEAEVIRRAADHMRETHGETVIRETMIEAIRSRIEKVRDAA
jgi:predicted small metal-binding protein